MNKKLNELSLKKNSTRSSWQLELSSFSLLDEPEVSLSPQNQVKLAEEINKMARYLDIQFIIATHSPVIAAIPDADIFQIDESGVHPCEYDLLNNVMFLRMFLKRKDSLWDK